MFVSGIRLQTSESYLLYFKLQVGAPLFLGFDVKNQPSQLHSIRLSSTHQCRVVFSKKEATCNCLAGDAAIILLGLDNGYLVQYSWEGKQASEGSITSLCNAPASVLVSSQTSMLEPYLKLLVSSKSTLVNERRLPSLQFDTE
eukprot:5050409-Pyramimonas_sp.AAC.5